MMLTDTLKMILPIVIAFCLGILCRRRRLISGEGCQTLKTIVSRLMLPVLLLNAFMFAEYSADSVILIVTLLLANILIMVIGWLAGHRMGEKGRYLPFLLSTMECGSIGYPLVTMLFSATGSMQLAILDVGITIFNFMIAIPLLQMADGKSPDVRGLLKSALLSPTMIAMLAGIVLGLLRVDELLAAQAPLYGIYSGIVSFITAPIGLLILITLGYDMSLRRDLLGRVMAVTACRTALMAAVGALSLFVITRLTTLRPEMLYTVILSFTLPPAFGIVMFADFEGQRDFVSTSISLMTLITLALFCVLTVVVPH
ncbi:MAG: hypothetical protein PUA52_08475 [Lachnospiraceae bacterium]|nr:hypothetical protein [Lachnospiraceae bacterium]